MTEKLKAVLFRLFLALCSFVFLLLFARYSSPLTPRELRLACFLRINFYRHNDSIHLPGC